MRRRVCYGRPARLNSTQRQVLLWLHARAAEGVPPGLWYPVDADLQEAAWRLHTRNLLAADTQERLVGFALTSRGRAVACQLLAVRA